MSSDDESPLADELTMDADSIAPSNSSRRRQPVPCPRCDTPVAVVVSYGPTTHRATPCGCPVSGSLLEKTGPSSD
ncbi:hypothetical protein [Natrinema salsiterrestre]|uniref:Small CPxCG-related zinc finger protein n=1 Tax=Natrinema salsiterrestre TaxID=2950540 RepID=A0A9Q4L2F8_9EURY|nr:hypothetical protein [Natrinema salsiterrestre]MDF9746946.1 hypothetical protein [Natrinema salsiterrestre]